MIFTQLQNEEEQILKKHFSLLWSNLGCDTKIVNKPKISAREIGMVVP